jgi:hypothetical protein
MHMESTLMGMERGKLVFLSWPAVALEHTGLELPAGAVHFLAMAIGRIGLGTEHEQSERMVVVCRDVDKHGCVIAVCKAIWVNRGWTSEDNDTTARPCREAPSISVTDILALLVKQNPATLSNKMSRMQTAVGAEAEAQTPGGENGRLRARNRRNGNDKTAGAASAFVPGSEPLSSQPDAPQGETRLRPSANVQKLLDGYKEEKWPTGYGPAKIKKECEMADGMERSQAMWAVCMEAGTVSQHHTKKFKACLRNNDTDGMGIVLSAVARGLKECSKQPPVDDNDGVPDGDDHEEDDDGPEGSSEVEELTERELHLHRKRNEVRRRAHDAEEREERQQQSRLEEGAKRRKKMQEEEERCDKEHRERLEESKRQRQRSIEWHRAEEQMRAAPVEKTGGGETEAEAVRAARAAAAQLAKEGEGPGGQQQHDLAAMQAGIRQVQPGVGVGEHLGAIRAGANCRNPLAHGTGSFANATYSPFTVSGMPHATGNPFPAPFTPHNICNQSQSQPQPWEERRIIPCRLCHRPLGGLTEVCTRNPSRWQRRQHPLQWPSTMGHR